MSELTSSNTELIRALAHICTEPVQSGELMGMLGIPLITMQEHTETFILQLVPNASIYLSSTGMLGGEWASRIGGFWRTIGMTPPADPDQLGLLLELYATLMEQHQLAGEKTRHGRAIEKSAAVLFTEYIISWLPAYLVTLKRIVHKDSGLYSWAQLLLSVISYESRLHPHQLLLNDLPTAEFEEQESDDLLRMLVTPRSAGVILTKSDLVQFGSELGLACRVGERAFVLRELFGQDPKGVLQQVCLGINRWLVDLEQLSAEHGLNAKPWIETSRSTFDFLNTLQNATPLSMTHS